MIFFGSNSEPVGPFTGRVFPYSSKMECEGAIINEYLNENTLSANSYLTNETSYSLNESNKLSFK